MFKYDVVTLIQLVEMRPCLWDRSVDSYKDRILKLNAWNDIFHLLEERYDDLSTEEQKEIGEKITTKWINIKDAYFKSLKTKSRHGSKKDYVYATHLQFLLKRLNRENTADTVEESVEVNTPIAGRITPDNVSTSDELNDDANRCPKQRKRDSVTIATRKTGNFEIQILEELQRRNERRAPQSLDQQDEDKFFRSFVPYLKDMTEEERIDLQMDILRSIKRIKRNRTLKLDGVDKQDPLDHLYQSSSRSQPSPSTYS